MRREARIPICSLFISYFFGSYFFRIIPSSFVIDLGEKTLGRGRRIFPRVKEIGISNDVDEAPCVASRFGFDEYVVAASFPRKRESRQGYPELLLEIPGCQPSLA